MYARRQSPKVKDGKVQKKNWHGRTHNVFDHIEPDLVILRQRPGFGARHLLTNAEVRAFVDLLPHWDEWSKGLNGIVLAPYEEDVFGLYTYSREGVITLLAWTRNRELELSHDFFAQKRWLAETLAVEQTSTDWGVHLRFTEPQAKAFLLLGTFLHEVGHHLDRMKSRKKIECDGGEPYAVAFEHEWQQKLWPVYRAKLLR